MCVGDTVWVGAGDWRTVGGGEGVNLVFPAEQPGRKNNADSVRMIIRAYRFIRCLLIIPILPEPLWTGYEAVTLIMIIK